ncbi:MAG: hypothetical protein OEY25_04185 [Candidatus Aminicenantes bacterium]|nr:hypothetical protein [Candidatus Aminicenantes bacterium]MDH5704888.1 hypothetical protein [Candidatus Aminicenantes bacterium]
MKFDKSTKILINLILVLLVVFLLKSITAVPKKLYAQGHYQYKIVHYEDEVSLAAMKEGAVTWEERLFRYEVPFKNMAEEGWRFHSDIKIGNYTLLVFER